MKSFAIVFIGTTLLSLMGCDNQIRARNILCVGNGDERRWAKHYVVHLLRDSPDKAEAAKQIADLIKREGGRGNSQLACASALFDLIQQEDNGISIPQNLVASMVNHWIAVGPGEIVPVPVGLRTIIAEKGWCGDISRAVQPRITVPIDNELVVHLNNGLLKRWKIRVTSIRLDDRESPLVDECVPMWDCWKDINVLDLIPVDRLGGMHTRVVEAVVVAPNGIEVRVTQVSKFNVLTDEDYRKALQKSVQ